jgi:2-polyprenyl-6-methoxyphenol hydroxylase-like FAD-dependent oxidoreductase
MLFDSLPLGIVRWKRRLRQVDPNDLSLHFDRGVEKSIDLIVGSDGAWSKVRPLLSDVRPFYPGVGGYDLFIEDAENKHPEFYNFVNRGSLFSISDHKAIGAQQLGDGSICVRAYCVKDEN